MLVAQRIGPGLQLDIYFAVTGFASALVGSIAAGATYLLPALIRANGKTVSQQALIAGNGVAATAAVGIIVALSTAVIFIANERPEQQNLAINYYYLLVFLGWACVLTTALATAWAAVANSHGRVIGTISFGTLPPTFIFIYLAWTGSPNVLGLTGFQLIGICLQTIGLSWLYRTHWNLPCIDYKEVARIAARLPMAAAGALCFSAYSAIDAWLSPSLGVGAMSHQAIAQRLVIAFSAIVSAGPFMLTPSITATMLEGGREDAVWKYITRTGITLTAICVFASALTPWLGNLVISILFQRGEFGSSDTQAISLIVTILLIGAGPMLATAVAFRVLHNKNCNRQVVSLSLAWVSFYAIFANLLSTYFGALSLSIAYSLAWVIIAIATFFTLARKLRQVI